jgi:arsenate reductase-like glutaredoxin family protein
MEMTTNPRAWTKFSNFIGKDVKNIQKILDVVEHYGLRYLHPSTIACFTRYLQNLSKIKLDDILNRFDEIKPVLDQLNKSYLNEFCEKLKTKKLNNLNKKQLENLIKFLDYIPDDEKCAYLCYIVDEHVSEDTCEDILKKKVSKSEKKNILKGYGNNFNTVINHFSDLIDILERKSKQLEDKEEKETKKVEKEEDEKKS